MTPCTYPELFEALVTSDIGRVLGQYFNANSCINSTRVLLEVFRRFGLAARPFAVRAMIFSNGFVERAGREGRIPQGEEEVQQWCNEPCVYSLGLGFGVPGMPRFITCSLRPSAKPAARRAASVCPKCCSWTMSRSNSGAATRRPSRNPTMARSSGTSRTRPTPATSAPRHGRSGRESRMPHTATSKRCSQPSAGGGRGLAIRRRHEAELSVASPSVNAMANTFRNAGGGQKPGLPQN